MYLFLDTETGGIDTYTSLLSAFFLVTSDTLEKVDSLSLQLKPNDGIFEVTGEALSINRINLIQHYQTACSYDEGGLKLKTLLNKYGSKRKLVVVGHNVRFDLQHIWDKIISREDWEYYVSYRCLDTQSVAQFLLMSGKLDVTKTNGSLKSLADYFHITPQDIGYLQSVDHDAAYDALLTCKVLQALLKL